MSDQINNGGPAFPLQLSESQLERGNQQAYGVSGMSLRDWFAGQALAGMTADPTCIGISDTIARAAYDFADAMLSAREVKP